MLKSTVTVIGCLFSGMWGYGQTLDSIYFNLYTDSLKKGTFNYINVDGRYSNGRYLPLGTKDLTFSASGGQFEGNSLFIDTSFHEEKVTVKVVVSANPSLKREIVIYIKKREDNEPLPTVEEIMNKPSGGTPASGRKNKRKK